MASSRITSFLPSWFNLDSIANDELGPLLEKIAKWGAIAVGALYVIGLLICGDYYGDLHVRSIEFVRMKYVFVGFYYCVFLYLHLIYAQLSLPGWWKKLFFYVAFFLVLVSFDPHNLNYMSHLLRSDKESKPLVMLAPGFTEHIRLDLVGSSLRYFVAVLLVGVAFRFAKFAKGVSVIFFPFRIVV